MHSASKVVAEERGQLGTVAVTRPNIEIRIAYAAEATSGLL